jgi:hypothetical protein
MTDISRLSWKQTNYSENHEEIPSVLEFDDVHTEGELMDRDQIDEWLAESNATFCIIREKNETKFDELFQEYVADIEYLHKLGKLTQAEAEQLSNPDLYRFNEGE